MANEQPTQSIGAFLAHYLHAQMIARLPYPTKTFQDQTIIITGSNIGLGLEAARHFVRLDAAKVILAVRNLEKGDAAKKSIIASEKKPDSTVEVWELDLASYASTIAFAERAKKLERLDVVVENAGIYMVEFEIAEDNESTITVNNISTFLLGLLLLPKLRESSVTYKKETVLTFTGSFVHFLTKFPEREAGEIFDELAIKEKANMQDRYNVSKIIELLVVRELASHITASAKGGNVVTSIINPGFVDTAIMRHAPFGLSLLFHGLKMLMARATEEGSRTLVWAGYGGEQTHGMYLDDCVVGKTSPWVVSENGKETGRRLWAELTERLEKMAPGIASGI